MLKLPTPGQLIKYKISGFENLPYIDEGIGFVESIKFDEQRGYKIKVHIFNKKRYRRKTFMEVMIGASQEEYSLDDFYNFFKLIEH